MELDYLLIDTQDGMALTFIGKRRDVEPDTVELCAPDGRCAFRVPRRFVTQITKAELARLLMEEARYRRGLSKYPPSRP